MEVIGASSSIFYSSQNTISTSSHSNLFSSSSSYFYSSSLSSASSSSSSVSSHDVSICDATFAVRVGRFMHVMITCALASVGSIVGAVTGGLIGLASESGPLKGAGLGAISGAVFTVEAFESSLSIWHSNESGISSILYVIDIICSLLSGRLARGMVDPPMRSVVESQMSAADSPLMEAIDIFDTGGTKGMTRESIDKLPKICITSQANADDMGQRICCVVCLQDFQIGETVRCLPYCHHKFHLPCIDGWLFGHSSCPLCRRDL